jgi:toxin ParE1/3/4
MKVVFAKRARQDVAETFDYIAQSNKVAAQRVENMIRATCLRLADFPLASAETDEPYVRRVPLVRFPYTVFYRIDAARDVIEIARVLHAARETFGQDT